jgi:hypothetical protein
MPPYNPYAAALQQHYPAASPLGDYVAHKQAVVAAAAAAEQYAWGYHQHPDPHHHHHHHRHHIPYGVGGPPQPPSSSATAAAQQSVHEIAIMQEAFRNERAATLKRTSGNYHPQFGPPLVTARGPMPAAAGAALASASLYSTSQHLPHASAVKSGKPSASSSRVAMLPHRGPGASPGTGGSEEGSEDDEEDDEEEDDPAEDDEFSGAIGTGYYENDDDSEMARFARTGGGGGGPPRKKETAVMSEDADGKPIVIDRGHTWYIGSVPLGVDDDKYWLSELQVYLRANFAEAFAATEEDIAAPMHGRNKPIALGQVRA